MLGDINEIKSLCENRVRLSATEPYAGFSVRKFITEICPASASFMKIGRVAIIPH